jgi:preprotein translocase subunit YajC
MATSNSSSSPASAPASTTATATVSTTQSGVDNGAVAVPVENSLGMQLAPMLLILVVFYFLMIRPQQKRAAKHQEMVRKLRKDDKVVTTGGIIGRVHKVINDREISLEVSEGVRIRVLSNSVSELLDKSAKVLVDDSSNSSDDDVEKPTAKSKASSRVSKTIKN